MITLLRTMTRRSIVGFGLNPDWRVDDFFKMKAHFELVKMYYKLGNVTFTEDVLMDLKITPERRIEKPGKSQDAYIMYAKQIFADMHDEENIFENYGIAASRKKAKRHRLQGKEFNYTNRQMNKNRNQGIGRK